MLGFFELVLPERLDHLGLNLALRNGGGRAPLEDGRHVCLRRRKFESRHDHVVRPGQSRCDLDYVFHSGFRRLSCAELWIARHVSRQDRVPPAMRRRGLWCGRVFRSFLWQRFPWPLGQGFFSRGFVGRGFVGARRFGNRFRRALATAALDLVL